MALILDGTQYARVTVTSRSSANPWSFFTYVNFSSLATGATQAIFLSSRNVAYKQIALRMSDTSDYMAARFQPNTNTIDVEDTGFTLATNTWYKAFCQWDEVNKEMGVQLGTQTMVKATGSHSDSTMTDLVIGCLFSAIAFETPVNFLSGKVAHPAQWDSLLTAGEITSLMDGSLKPNEITTSPTHYKPFIADQTGGIGTDYTLFGSPTIDSEDPHSTGVTLVIQDASHAQTADNISLIQANTLVMQDATHSQTAENLDLSQDFSLLIQEALHAQTSENLDLVQANTLAVQEAAHSQTADEVNLVVSGSGTYTVSGTGFGTAPTVVHYEDYENDTEGVTIGTAAKIGTWNTDVLSGKQRPVLETWSGRKAWKMWGTLDGPNDEDYELRRGSMTPFGKFMVFHKFGIPTGKTFPGGIAEGASWAGSPSSLKSVWFTYNNEWASGATANPDFVTPTHIGGGDFTNAGNSIKGRQANDTWPRSWGSWNNYICIYKDESLTTGYVENWGYSANASRDYRLTSNVDVFEGGGFAGTLNARAYDSFTLAAWSGNGDNTNTQVMYGAFYLATGDNCHKYILLGNNASLDLCTDVDVVPHQAWSDTSISFDKPPDATNLTHYFIMDRNSILTSGVLPATGGVSLVIQETGHAQTADNLDLIQANTLVIQETTHSQTADNVVLNVGGTLIIQDALHGHSCDNIALIQANVLAIGDAIHTHTVGNVVLVAGITLTVQEAIHAHTSENLDLSQANILAIQDAIHAHTSENLDLSQANVLIVSDALHSHIADNIALSIPLGFDIVTPDNRIFVIAAQDRNFIIIKRDPKFIIN